jgi:hypothetical protein
MSGAGRAVCEVVLATAGDVALGDTGGAWVLREDLGWWVLGLLRNAGAEAARGRMLYLSDADVAPLGWDYLSRALLSRTAAGGHNRGCTGSLAWRPGR